MTHETESIQVLQKEARGLQYIYIQSNRQRMYTPGYYQFASGFMLTVALGQHDV